MLHSFCTRWGFAIWAAESPGNDLSLGGEEYRGREIGLDLTLETKTEKKWTRKKWPKPLLPHPCSIFDIADLEYRNSTNFIRSGWISAFQSCQNFRNRSIVAKTVHLFVRTVGFGGATPPSANYPDNRLHIPQTARFWNLKSTSILDMGITSEDISRGICLLWYAENIPNKVNLCGKWKRKSVKMIWVDSSQLRDLTTMGRSHPWPRTWSGEKCVG